MSRFWNSASFPWAMLAWTAAVEFTRHPPSSFSAIVQALAAISATYLSVKAYRDASDV